MSRQLDLTLSRIRLSPNIRDTDFLRIYSLLLNESRVDLSDQDKLFILKIAIIFIESADRYVSELGYRIVLLYSLKFQDFEALNEIAILFGYMPIVNFIETHHSGNNDYDAFSATLLSAYKNTFKHHGQHIIRTSGQMLLHKFASENSNTTIVAPTSYGKSELLIKKVTANIGRSICIVVPSKALLSQTKRLVSKDEAIISIYSKIITHPDMYHGEESLLAVLTQERLLRLLKSNPELQFDIVLLDEAHNLLGKESRAVLTAQVLLLCNKRNQNVDISFYTPFLANTDNVELVTSHAGENGKTIKEHMKIEKFFYTKYGHNGLYLYDQYLNKTLLEIPASTANIANLVIERSSTKNLVYINRPVRVEQFANRLTSIIRTPNNVNDPYLDEVVEAISQLVHPQYSLIDCIKNGVVFHHGGLPDTIRLFVEDFFAKNSRAKYLVCTSTLLEGVNIPAEKIFVLTPQKYPGNLSNSEFKNLIGRVSRFSEIFNPDNGNLNLLQPEVYMLSTEYSPSNFNPESFLKDNASINIEADDAVLNPLLKHTTNIEKRESELQYLENIEPGTTDLVAPQLAETEIGRLCFANGIRDFNILENEVQIAENFVTYIAEHGSVNDPSSLLEAICDIFLKDTVLNDDTNNLKRIKDNEEARLFYGMFIGWRAAGAPYGLMVNSFVRYWSTLTNPLVFVGSRWGDTAVNGWRNLYVDLRTKNQVELINLAIAKIKEEQDYIDHNIMQYAEILKDMQMIDAAFYDKFKYGTDDQNMIVMLKNGFSMELAKLIIANYMPYVEINQLNERVTLDPSLIQAMRVNNENTILVFEAQHQV